MGKANIEPSLSVEHDVGAHKLVKAGDVWRKAGPGD